MGFRFFLVATVRVPVEAAVFLGTGVFLAGVLLAEAGFDAVLFDAVL
jgi:hypothetical protein